MIPAYTIKHLNQNDRLGIKPGDHSVAVLDNYTYTEKHEVVFYYCNERDLFATEHETIAIFTIKPKQ
jgi:hypothetical protein